MNQERLLTAPEVEKNFVETLEFAGLLKNGIIYGLEDIDVKDPINSEEEDSSAELQDTVIRLPSGEVKDVRKYNMENLQRSEINLSTGKAIIFLPSELLPEDAEILKSLIDVYARNLMSKKKD